MKNEFVSYEMALELKELGFDEQCICGYNDYHLLRSKISSSFDGDFVKWDEKYDKDLKAPLYQTAFRFFREKYKLPSWVYTSNNEKFYYGILRDTRFLIDGNKSWETYEEAELACLNKLIETVKNIYALTLFSERDISKDATSYILDELIKQSKTK